MTNETLAHLQNRLRQLVSFDPSTLFDPETREPLEFSQLPPDTQANVVKARMDVLTTKNVRYMVGNETKTASVPDQYSWHYEVLNDKDRTNEIVRLQREIEKIEPSGKTNGPQKMMTADETAEMMITFLEERGFTVSLNIEAA